MPVVRIDPALAQRRTAQMMAQAQRDIPLFHVSKDAAAEALQLRARTHRVSSRTPQPRRCSCVPARTGCPSPRRCSRSWRDRFEATDFATPTFTVSNLGAMGIDAFTSLVTPPQVAVLSVAATSLRPVQRDGELTLGQVLTLTLGVDHRAIDGATAARALADLVNSLEADHG